MGRERIEVRRRRKAKFIRRLIRAGEVYALDFHFKTEKFLFFAPSLHT